MNTRRWIFVTLAALTVVGCVPKQKRGGGPGGSSGSGATRRDPNDGKVVIPAPEASTNKAPPDATNPFVGAQYFINPEYVKEVEDAATAAPELADKIKKVAQYPTATWLVMNSFVAKVPKVLDLAAKQSSDGKPVLSAFVVYNLPNRDCAAKSSSGELTVENNGEQLYKSEFIDKIAAHFAKYPKQRIVVFLEPDSLPNMVTNVNLPKCAAAEQVYKSSIAYAIQKLAMPHVSIYMDIGHTGWLGWEGNRQRGAKLYHSVMTQAGGVEKVRGFVTNISNYNTVSSRDGAKLGPTNPCPDELTYIEKLSEVFDALGAGGKKFVIDTSRNGRPVRYTWSSWCNIKGAGIGPRPQASPHPLIDAYFWIKPPGESDGTSDPKAARGDEACRRDDSMPNAPEAGEWFQSYFIELVKNAEPTL